MSRVLFDTNVYISALVFGGKPALALRLAESPGIEIAVSSEIESEFVETLTGKFGWSRARVDEARRLLWERAYWARLGPLQRLVRDPDDDHIVAAALASEARLIVTGDADLLELGEFRGIRVITPSAFIDMFARGAS